MGREKKKLVGFQPHHGCGVRVWLWSGCGSLCEGGWWAAAAVCVTVREAGQWAEKKKSEE